MSNLRLPLLGSRPSGCAGPCPPSCTCGPSSRAPGSGLSRRTFLAGMGAVAAGVAAPLVWSRRAGANLVVPAARTVSYAPPPIPGVQFAMAIDLKKCIGCRKCAYACRVEENIGRDSNFVWMELHRMERGTFELENSDVYYTEAADPRYWYLPVGCQQCENPPCVQACPVQATWRDPDGIVVIDYDKCIGCRYCIVNCPYGARHFNWKKPVVPERERNPEVPVRPVGVVEKCTFCVHRTRRGKLPACVEVCPVGARVFGNLADPASPVSQLLATRTPMRLKENLGTRPRVFFVG